MGRRARHATGTVRKGQRHVEITTPLWYCRAHCQSSASFRLNWSCALRLCPQDLREQEQRFQAIDRSLSEARKAVLRVRGTSSVQRESTVAPQPLSQFCSRRLCDHRRRYPRALQRTRPLLFLEYWTSQRCERRPPTTPFERLHDQPQGWDCPPPGHLALVSSATGSHPNRHVDVSPLIGPQGASAARAASVLAGSFFETLARAATATVAILKAPEEQKVRSPTPALRNDRGKVRHCTPAVCRRASPCTERCAVARGRCRPRELGLPSFPRLLPQVNSLVKRRLLTYLPTASTPRSGARRACALS